jgi:hypothetical protein
LYNGAVIGKILHALFPHKGNDYKPDILERFAMGLMFVLVILSFGIANIHALLWRHSDWLTSSILPAVVVDLTNDERGNDALHPLTRNGDLDRAAFLKAEDMAKNGYFAHFSPSGVSPWHWFDVVGYDYVHAGENLAVHFSDSDAVVDAWMNSPLHRANIMNGKYSEIGVGSAKGMYKGHETVFVVQLFGTKREQTFSAVRVDTPFMSAESLSSSDTESEESEDISVETDLFAVRGASQLSQVEIETTSKEIAQKDSSSTVEAFVTSGERETSLLTETEISESAPLSKVSAPLRSSTNPALWLQSLYGFLAILILGSLILSLLYEWRKHHLYQTAYAGGLIALMALLFHVHVLITGSVEIL